MTLTNDIVIATLEHDECNSTARMISVVGMLHSRDEWDVASLPLQAGFGDLKCAANVGESPVPVCTLWRLQAESSSRSSGFFEAPRPFLDLDRKQVS